MPVSAASPHSRFITNQNALLSELIQNIIPGTEKLHFLVGYFYFSGFEQIYTEIGIDKHMHILVGMEAESTVTGAVHEFSKRSFEQPGEPQHILSRPSHEKIQRDYLDGLVKAANSNRSTRWSRVSSGRGGLGWFWRRSFWSGWWIRWCGSCIFRTRRQIPQTPLSASPRLYGTRPSTRRA